MEERVEAIGKAIKSLLSLWLMPIQERGSTPTLLGVVCTLSLVADPDEHRRLMALVATVRESRPNFCSIEITPRCARTIEVILRGHATN